MNFSAFTRSILIGTSLIAASYAASAQVRQPTVFMLQFGSFETKDEAESKLKSIGTKHGGMLTKYPSMIREIVMPPDNLTVYRTQAGPVNTRETAQSVCSQLASQGDECYVVETAMVQPGAPPAQQQAGIVPLNEKPTPDAEEIIPTDSRPMPARDPDNLRALEKVTSPVPQANRNAMDEAMDSAAAAPTLSTPSARLNSNAKLAGATKTPEAAVEENEGSFWSWLGDDDDDADARAEWEKAKAEASNRANEEAAQNRAAPVDSVATEDMTSLAPPAVLKPMPHMSTAAPTLTPMPQMNTEAPVQTPAPRIEDANTMRPMPQMAPPVLTPMPQATAEAPPVDIVSPNLQATAPSNPVFAPPAPVLAPVSEKPLQQQIIAQRPEAPIEAYVGSQGIKLPPPPPPMMPSTSSSPQTSSVMPVPPMMAPPPAQPYSGPSPVFATPAAPESTGSITSSNLAPAPFKKGTSVPPGGGEDMSKTGAKVEVGEAQRVPLTEAQQQAPVEQLPAKVIGVNEPPEVADNVPPPPPSTPVEPPSSPVNMKTLWAHIHYFPDQQAALSFWDGYRKAHPDFPVVRVRTTSWLMPQQQGDLRVALRVGPFSQQGFINILCNSVRERNDNVECGAITDMGATSNAYAPRDRYAQAAAASARYANQIVHRAEGFWVQLGTYPSAAEAELAWEDAQTQHGDALGNMKAAISSPEQGSQAHQVFRLRTGPFTTQMAAKDVCSRVKVNSGSCLVVSE